MVNKDNDEIDMDMLSLKDVIIIGVLFFISSIKSSVQSALRRCKTDLKRFMWCQGGLNLIKESIICGNIWIRIYLNVWFTMKSLK